MTILTIEKLIELGGNEWVKGDIKRVYITQDLFNKVTGFGLSLNISKWKFYVDTETSDLFRTNGKKPVREGNLSGFTI